MDLGNLKRSRPATMLTGEGMPGFPGPTLADATHPRAKPDLAVGTHGRSIGTPAVPRKRQDPGQDPVSGRIRRLRKSCHGHGSPVSRQARAEPAPAVIVPCMRPVQKATECPCIGHWTRPASAP